jgi:hypothetical protein
MEKFQDLPEIIKVQIFNEILRTNVIVSQFMYKKTDKWSKENASFLQEDEEISERSFLCTYLPLFTPCLHADRYPDPR